jgi:hypothetical protein
MAVFLVFGALTFFGPDTVQANPKDIDPGLKKVYQFNLIGKPVDKEYTGGCGGGSRIFVNRDAHHAHILVTDHDDGWHVANCNATAANTGELHTDELGLYKVYVRILGKPGGTLDICAETVVDHSVSVVGETLCDLGTIKLLREGGQSKFQIAVSTMFDAELEDIMWSVDTNKDYRIAQFRVYRIP